MLDCPSPPSLLSIQISERVHSSSTIPSCSDQLMEVCDASDHLKLFVLLLWDYCAASCTYSPGDSLPLWNVKLLGTRDLAACGPVPRTLPGTAWSSITSINFGQMMNRLSSENVWSRSLWNLPRTLITNKGRTSVSPRETGRPLFGWHHPFPRPLPHTPAGSPPK